MFLTKKKIWNADAEEWEEPEDEEEEEAEEGEEPKKSFKNYIPDKDIFP